MKRTKKRISVSVITLPEDNDIILGAMENAYAYADEVHVFHTESGKGVLSLPDDDYYGLVQHHPVLLDLRHANSRAYANRLLWPNSDPPEDLVVFYLEAGHRIDNTDLARFAVEYNPGKILTAMRYFQWDEDHYRADDQYRPQRLPIAGGYSTSAHWSDNLQTAPDWMWARRSQWVEVPFNIIDVTFMDPSYRWDDGKPDLQPLPERIFS